MGYNLLLNGVYRGYNPLTNLLLTSWDIQVPAEFHQKLNGTLPTDPGPSKLRVRAIRYSGFFGVRSVGPVGDFLDEWLNFGLFFLDLFSW